jgi:HEAT repeat protein
VGLQTIKTQSLRHIVTIDIGIDREGHSLRVLIYQALEGYPTKSLLPFLRDRSAIVRTAAARHLQIRADSEVFEHAMQLVDSSTRQDREIAAFILGQLGTPDRPFKAASIAPLEKLCADAAHEVRVAALAALGHLGASAAAQSIRRARRDSHPDVRAMAAYVRKQVGL